MRTCRRSLHSRLISRGSSIASRPFTSCCTATEKCRKATARARRRSGAQPHDIATLSSDRQLLGLSTSSSAAMTSSRMRRACIGRRDGAAARGARRWLSIGGAGHYHGRHCQTNRLFHNKCCSLTSLAWHIPWHIPQNRLLELLKRTCAREARNTACGRLRSTQLSRPNTARCNAATTSIPSSVGGQVNACSGASTSCSKGGGRWGVGRCGRQAVGCCSEGHCAGS